MLISLLPFLAKGIEDTSYLHEPEHIFWHDLTQLPTLKLRFDDSQWSLLLESERSDRNEVSANLTYTLAGQEYHLNNIGVKLSGNTSFTLPESAFDPFIQANFTLDFDEFVDDQTLSGISALKLKRFKDDSTFVHEPLSNQIMHNFGIWTAHSSTYVRVEIEVASRGVNYFGLYRLNESVNRHEYLDKRFDSDNDGGVVWQGNHKRYGAAFFSKITADWEGVGDFDDASFEYKGKGSKFEEGKAQLVEMALNFTQLTGSEFQEYAERHINMELFLKSLAAEAVLGHWDGFWGNGNNYMFYIDEREVLHFIPFDTDNTLGTSLIVDDVGERDPFEFGTSRLAPPLVTKTLGIDAFRQQFAQYLYQLVNQEDLMNQEYAVDWIQRAHELIDGHLENVTGDNENIADAPASWGNQDDYRLFDLASGKNWYLTRKDTVLTAVGAPQANAGNDIRVEADQVFQLSGSNSSDADGEITKYSWSIGIDGENVSHSFSTPGEYTITLSVTDNNGFSARDDLVVNVRAKAQPAPTPADSGGGSPGPLFYLTLAWILIIRRNRPISDR